MTDPVDPTAITGKIFPVRRHVPLVVVGAGAAGLAAALEAARLGLEVMLVDEHPIDAGLAGMDVPLLFGDRLGPALRNRARMLEQVVAARPGIEAAFEAGIDVQLGVAVWAAFVPGPTSRSQPRPLLAVADEASSWLVSWDRMIVAAGARDFALALPGWDRPGVMGSAAFAAALDLYAAFDGRRLVILGSGRLGLETALRAHAAGLDVAAVVEAADIPQGPPDLVAAITASGIPIRCGTAVSALSGVAGVERVTLRGNDGAEAEIACDTVVQAIDLVPTVELLDLVGARIVHRADLGGFVPLVDGNGRTTVDRVFAVGDCAGIGDAETAIAAGRRAARAAARDAGIEVLAESPAPAARPAGFDCGELRRRWVAATVASGGAELMVCRCEGVTVGDLIGVRPPAYLRYDAAPFDRRNLHSLAAEGPLDQDQIKRLTRSGMGPCQGRRCREQVQVLVALNSNMAAADVPMPSHRAPLRPLPLAVMSAADEPASVRENWSAWFGIPAQWLPHWEAAPDDAEFWGGKVPIPDIMK